MQNLSFKHKYFGYNEDLQQEYYCDIILNGEIYVGYCKYVKTSNDVFIEYIQIRDIFRRKGYATAMVVELSNKFNLVWNGRFTKEGRYWYESMIKKGVIKP